MDRSLSERCLRRLPGSRRDRATLCERIAAAGQGMSYAGCEVHIHNAGISETPADRRLMPHEHSYTEALLVLAGRAVETIGFGQELTPGVLQVHVPGARHGWEGTEGRLRPETRSYGDRLVRFGVRFTTHPPIPLRPLKRWPCRPEALADLEALLREAERRGTGAQERIHARLFLLMSHFFDCLDWSRGKADAARAQRPLEDLIEQFLIDNLGEKMTLRDVAIVANLSVPALTRNYRLRTGQTVMGRLLALRLQEAVRLLTTTKLPVNQIAERVGFDQASYFCRRFKQHFGCTANQYRLGEAAQSTPFPGPK